MALFNINGEQIPGYLKIYRQIWVENEDICQESFVVFYEHSR